jgi:hypothetical protein
MAKRIGRGSLSGALVERGDRLPCMGDSVVLEKAITLPAGSRLRAGWLRRAGETQFLSRWRSSPRRAIGGDPWPALTLVKDL